MKRTIAIIIIALAFTALNVWHTAVKAQDTIVHDGKVQVLGEELEISNATNPHLEVTDTTNTVLARLQSEDNDAFAGTISNHPFELRTNNSPRLYIQADGDIGIGTTAPESFLHVVSAATGMLIGDNVNDDQNKLGLFGTEHFDVDEPPFYALNISTTATDNILYLGGAFSLGNASTDINFIIAANNTTTADNGTQILHADIAAVTLAADLLMQGNYISLTEMADPGGAANALRMYAFDNAGTTELCIDWPGGDTECGTDLCAGCLDPNP